MTVTAADWIPKPPPLSWSRRFLLRWTGPALVLLVASLFVVAQRIRYRQKVAPAAWQPRGQDDPSREGVAVAKFGPKPRPAEDRFWSKVDKGDGTGCWLWTGYIMGNGYGTFHLPEGPALAHRAAYEFLVGPIPEGLTIDHVKANGCTSKACVKAVADEYGPSHLEAVTMRENQLRGEGQGVLNARKTHCPQGHPYDAANTGYTRVGNRYCRTCARERMRAKRVAV